MSSPALPPDFLSVCHPDSARCCARQDTRHVLGAKLYAAFSQRLSDDAADGKVLGIGPIVFKCGSARGRACGNVPPRLNTDSPKADKGRGRPAYAHRSDWSIVWCRPTRYLHIDRLEFLAWISGVAGAAQVDYAFDTKAARSGKRVATELVVLSPGFLDSRGILVAPDPLFSELLQHVRRMMVTIVVPRLAARRA